MSQTVLTQGRLRKGVRLVKSQFKESDTYSLQYMLDTTLDILESNGIEAWLDYGTLLSVWRDKALVADSSGDVDIAIHFSDNSRAGKVLQENLPLHGLDVCNKVPGLNPKILPHKHVVMETNFTSLLRYRVFPSALNVRAPERALICSSLLPGLDLFSYSQCTDSFLCRADVGFTPIFPMYGFGYVPVPREWILPLTFLSTSRKQYRVPRQPERYLELRYGCLGAVGSVCRPLQNIHRFYEPIQADFQADSPVTMVTGLWDIKADKLNCKDNRTFESYKHKWFPNTLRQIRFPLVIFVGHPEMVNFTWHLRGCNESSHTHDEVLCRNTWIHLIPVESLMVETGNTWINNLVNMTDFLSVNLALRRDEYTLPDRPELTNPWLQALWFHKVNMVNFALEVNPFKSSYFAWIDAGFSHGAFSRAIQPQTIDYISEQPLSQLTRGGHLTIEGINTTIQKREICQNLALSFRKHTKMYSTNFMIASKKTWKETVWPKFYEHLSKTLQAGMLDDDMAIFISMSCENSSLIHIPCLSPDKPRIQPHIPTARMCTFNAMMKHATPSP